MKSGITVIPQTVNGIISGTGGIIKTGKNKLTLNGSNTYTGATLIKAGTLALGASGTIANSSSVTLDAIDANGGILDISTGNQTVKSLTTLQPENKIVLGASTLQIGTSSASADGNGKLEAGTDVSGTGGSIMKTGTQTFIMEGNSTATGTLYLTAGTLQVLGGNWSGGNVNQSSGTILDVVGTFNVGGSLSLNGGSVNMYLNATNPSKIVAGSVVSLSGVTGLNLSATAGNYTLIQGANGLLNSHSNGRFSFPTIGDLTLTPNSTATTLTLAVELAPGTGIKNVQSSDLKLWINNGELRIENAETFNGERLMMFDLTGRLTLNEKFAGQAINISSLPNAVYIVKIGNCSGKIVKK